MRLQSVIISFLIWAAILGAAAAETPVPMPDTPDQALRQFEAIRLQSAAETAFLTTNQTRGFEILNEIEKSFPEYYEMNRIRFLLLEALALEEMGRYPETALRLTMIHDWMQRALGQGLSRGNPSGPSSKVTRNRAGSMPTTGPSRSKSASLPHRAKKRIFWDIPSAPFLFCRSFSQPYSIPERKS